MLRVQEKAPCVTWEEEGPAEISWPCCAHGNAPHSPRPRLLHCPEPPQTETRRKSLWKKCCSQKVSLVRDSILSLWSLQVEGGECYHLAWHDPIKEVVLCPETLIKLFLYKLKPFFPQGFPFVSLPHEPQPRISVTHPPGSSQTCCGFPRAKCALRSPHELSGQLGHLSGFPAPQKLQDFEKFREGGKSTFVQAAFQAKRALETFAGHWGSFSSLWDVECSGERILWNSIFKAQCHT